MTLTDKDLEQLAQDASANDEQVTAAIVKELLEYRAAKKRMMERWMALIAQQEAQFAAMCGKLQ